jgi:hypothetical protein
VVHDSNLSDFENVLNHYEAVYGLFSGGPSEPPQRRREEKRIAWRTLNHCRFE